jgi:hypothetical protein
MKYLVPRLCAEPGASGWITTLDEQQLMRIETVPHGRAIGVLVQSPDGEALAVVQLERKLARTAAVVEIGGERFATLSFQSSRRQGAVGVRCAAGDYDVAGDFDAWDFHVLLNASPVADVAPRKTDRTRAVVETSDTEEQLPLLAMILAVDLLVRASS